MARRQKKKFPDISPSVSERSAARRRPPKKSASAVAAAPPPDATELDPDHQSLWGQVESLYRLAEANSRLTDNTLMFYFHEALNIGNEAVPARDDLERAKREFFALPIEDQRRLLNGWQAEAELPTRDEVAADLTAAGDVRQQLCVHLRDGAVSFAHHTCGLSDSASGIEVHFSLGTTKAEALRSVEALQRFIDTRWWGIVGNHDATVSLQTELVESTEK